MEEKPECRKKCRISTLKGMLLMVLLTALIAMAFSGCTKSTNTDITSKWKFEKLSVVASDMTLKKMTEQGRPIPTFVSTDGKNFTLTSNANEYKGTIKKSGGKYKLTITSSGRIFDATIKNGELIMVLEGSDSKEPTTYTFKKAE